MTKEDTSKVTNKRQLYAIRVCINIVVLGVLAAALYGIEESVVAYSESTGSLEGLVPSFVMAAFNLVLPVVFELLCRFEQWKSPLFIIQICVLRYINLCVSVSYPTPKNVPF